MSEKAKEILYKQLELLAEVSKRDCLTVDELCAITSEIRGIAATLVGCFGNDSEHHESPF